jgi:hypothetical protein
MSMLDDLAARLRSLLGHKAQYPAGVDLAGDEWQEAVPLMALPARPTEDQEWAARIALAKCDGDPRTNRPTAADDEWAVALLTARRQHTLAFARKVERVAARKGPPPIPRAASVRR